MSFADEDELSSFIHRDHVLPHITSEAVEKKLLENDLELAGACTSSWLATAVRRALGITVRNHYDSPDRAGNAAIRVDLEKLAEGLDSIWLRLHECEWETERRIWEHSWLVWDGEGGKDVGDGMALGTPTLHKRFKKTVQEIDWLARFLKEVARETDEQKGPWRQSERASLALERAMYLAPIFETAFAKKPTGNNYPSGTHKNPTDFMKFYQAMAHIAFEEAATPNLPKVIKDACRFHRESPAKFAEGMLPKLSGE